MSNLAMSMKEVKNVAPAAFTEAPSPNMSGRYGFINTSDVLGQLIDSGYAPVQAGQDKPRQRDPRHVRHRVILRHENFVGDEAVVGEQVPQIILINSHNGRTGLHLHAGLYRFVCANGMVVGDDKLHVRVNHVGDVAAMVDEYLKQFTKSLDRIQHAVEHWSHIELSDRKAREFAKAAAKLRFGASASSYEPGALLEARRDEDRGRDLWRVFNVVQENTVKGNVVGFNSNNRHVRSRELTGIGQDVAYNEQLWRLAEQVAA